MSNKQSVISSNWPGYRRIWIIIAILLLLLLLLLWLLGYGPGGKQCEIPPKVVEKTVEVEKLVDNPSTLNRLQALEKENAAIAGLQSRIKELESAGPKIVDNPKLLERVKILEAENGKIPDLKGRLQQLEKENSEIVVLKETINKLEEENGQIAKLKQQIGQLQQENTQISALQNKIKTLENAKPKIKIVEKVVKKIVRVPAEPVAPAAPSAPVQLLNHPTAPTPALPEMAKLYFDVGSSEFPADTNLSLAGIISYLRSHPDAVAVISGYHDASGNKEANIALSKKRAQEVARLLIEAGIPKEKMTFEKPRETLGTGSPQEARRVEVKIGKP